MPPSAARSHLPREPDTDYVRSITRRMASIHPTAEKAHSRKPSFRHAVFSETGLPMHGIPFTALPRADILGNLALSCVAFLDALHKTRKRVRAL
jgi:hypothetical protein